MKYFNLKQETQRWSRKSQCKIKGGDGINYQGDDVEIT